MRRQKDIHFLRSYLQELRKWYTDSFHLLPCDLHEPSEADRAKYEVEAERVARLADDNGFDGSLFRDHLLETPDDDPLSLQAIRRLRRKIGTIPRIMAKLEEPKPAGPEQSSPSEGKLLTVKQVAKVLGLGQSTVYQHNRRGLMPRPTELGGSLRWDADELKVWRKHRCPGRAEWERNREKWMEEVNNVTA